MKGIVNFTIFGGTGDLTFRKLLPALYNMSISGRLDDNSKIIIIGRRDYTTEEYCGLAHDWVEEFARLPYQKDDFLEFSQRLIYYQMDFSDLASYDGLNQFYQKHDLDTHIFYFAVAPRFFGTIVDGLIQVESAKTGKVIIEKPFGENLDAARELNQKMEAFFLPGHIYRIDHYLGKEMVRNIQTIRFTNPIFSTLWDAKHIECIQISAMEDVGVESRGGYYDSSGALKDMVQNHLFQILSIVAMEQPEQFAGPQMHTEQLKVLHSLRPITTKNIKDSLLLGQYEGYQQEPHVSEHSNTETYAALRLFIDNKRWKGMPFYIRTGKKLGRREMDVAIIFRRPSPDIAPNILNIKIQPTEGVYLQFNIKEPGDTDAIIQTKMDFCQSCQDIFRINTPEAYERMLDACVMGERTWFSRWDQVETSWTFIENIRNLYLKKKLPVFSYEPGTPGPEKSDEFLEHFGHDWFGEGESSCCL